MSAPLQSGYKAINPYAFAVAWFGPLGAANAIGTKRWNVDLPKPYRWVSVPVNARGGSYVTAPIVRVHTLAGTFTDAAREADRTDNRAQVLVDYPGRDVTVGGATVRCLYAEILDAAHEEPYAAETVAVRFVSEYRFGFTLISTT